MAATIKSSSSSLQDAFQTNLQMRAAKQIGRWECEKNCLSACGLDRIQDQELVAHCESIVHQFISVAKSEKNLVPQFTSSLAYAVEKRWLSVQARAFLDISSITDDRERQGRAQVWAGQFFKEAKFFNDCKNGPDISGLLIRELWDIQDAFQQAWWNQRMQSIVQKWKRDPNSIDKEDWDVVGLGEHYIHKFWFDGQCRMPWIKRELGLLCGAIAGSWSHPTRSLGPAP